MKKKKKRTVPTEQPQPAPRMTRREARIAARLSEEQRETQEVFRQRMKNAPPRSRLRPVRTKGYYRFAKDYPAAAGTDGFRENRPPSQKLSAAAKWLVLLCCAIVFCCAFILTRSAMKISAMPGDADYLATPTDPLAAPGIRARHISAEELAGYSPMELKRLTEASGCNTALFELKDEAGNIVFPTELARGSAGDYTVENAWETVAALEALNVRTAAYICCFRDSAASAYDDKLAVMDFDDPDQPLVDSDGSLWLDPYLPETVEYLTGLMRVALEGGFSYVVLDHVSFPYDLGLRTAYFSGADVADQGENSILLDFLAQALDVTGTGQLILMCDVNGLTADAMARDNRYGGSLLTCGAEQFAVDARLSRQPEDEPDPLGLFAYKDDVPTAFILSVCSEANNAAKSSEYVDRARVMVCVDNDGNTPALRELLDHTGLEDYIIW